MSELNTNAIPAINAVEGFNPADFVRNTVGEEGENDLYLDVKYRLLWFRLRCPNGKIDPELVHLDEKSAVVCCKVYADKADPADQFIGKAYSQRFPTEERFGDRFLEIAETVAKGRALADAVVANGGQISVSHPEPWANPSAPGTILRWLGREDAPLLFRIRVDAAQWRWGLSFLRECLPRRAARNTAAIASLAIYSRQQLRALRQDTGLRYESREGGILHLFEKDADDRPGDDDDADPFRRPAEALHDRLGHIDRIHPGRQPDEERCRKQGEKSVHLEA